MKIKISEKQLKMIHENLNEQEATAQTTTQGTTSTTTGYPAVGKWESGVTRGPANQVGNTKWSEVVGSTLKRGKANPLK